MVPGQQTTTNAGEAEISGLEVEGQLQLTDSVSLDFTYGLLNTEYTEIGMATTIELGTPFPFSPEHSYSLGAQWDHDLNSGSSIAAVLIMATSAILKPS